MWEHKTGISAFPITVRMVKSLPIVLVMDELDIFSMRSHYACFFGDDIVFVTELELGLALRQKPG